MAENLPAFDGEEIVKVAERYCSRYYRSGCNPADIEEVMGEFILAMVEAASKAEEGRAVRAYQWSYAIGRVKNWWAARHSEVCPADINGDADPIREKENEADDYNACICASLDAGEAGATFGDSIPAKTLEPADMLEPETHQVQIMRVCLSRLPEHIAEVLRRRYLLDQTLDEIGSSMGLTKQRISQIERDGLERMRRMLQAA
jgi:RNA polymerase sigma factor (sigma-70 family)